MNINYTKKSLGSINTVSATNTKININSNTTKLSGDYFQSKSALKEAKETSIAKVEFIKQLNEYVIDPATAYNDIIDLKNSFTEEEWEEYYKELSPEAKARADFAIKIEVVTNYVEGSSYSDIVGMKAYIIENQGEEEWKKIYNELPKETQEKIDKSIKITEVQNNIMNSDEEDIIDIKDKYSDEEWEEIYNNLTPEAQKKVKEAEEWKKKKEEDNKPWWEKVGGFFVGVVSCPVKLFEKGVDFTVSFGATAVSKSTYIVQGMTGVDMQFARDAVEGGAKDFIKMDMTKDARDFFLDKMGASDEFKQMADIGDEWRTSFLRSALKTGASLAPPPINFALSGRLAEDTYAEEIQTAYQNGATFDEGLISATGCSAVDFGCSLIPGQNMFAAGGRTMLSDTAKDVIRWGVYDRRNNPDFGSYMVSNFPSNFGNTLSSAFAMKTGLKLTNGGSLPASLLKKYSFGNILGCVKASYYNNGDTIKSKASEGDLGGAVGAFFGN